MRRRIVALLQDHPDGLTPAEMQTLLGVDRSLSGTCRGMLRYGLVQRVGRGRYAVSGRLGQTSTDFEVKPRNSAPMLGIEDGASGKTAPEAGCCVPFVEIREASAECLSRKTITRPHGKTG
jgi:hypothetical protein